MELSPELLPIALARTKKPITLRDQAGARVATICAAELQAYLDRGYVAHGTKRAVRYLAPPQPKRNPWRAHFEPCYRNQAAAVLWPFIDSHTAR